MNNEQKIRIDTFQASSFMPPLKDTQFYFGQSWRPAEKDLYYPKKNYKAYQVQSLGQSSILNTKNTFENLAKIGVGLYVNEQTRKDNENARKFEIEREKIKADALITIAKEQAKTPVVVSENSNYSPALLIAGGTVFVAAVGGLMFFMTQKG